MVSLETVSAVEAPSSPRISFQADFLESSIFTSIITTTPHHHHEDDEEEVAAINNSDFEFLISGNNLNLNNNITQLDADELFSEGKILPFWQMQSEKLKKINLRTKEDEDDGEKENNPVKEHHHHEEDEEQIKNKEEGNSNNKVIMNNSSNNSNWLVDEDPSPRPPNCTVLWKELLRLKKQRSSTSSNSSSSSGLSPSSSSSSSSSSLSDTDPNKQQIKGMKKLERTRSTSVRIRPMINVPICTQVKTSSLPPLFSHKKRK